MQGRNDPPDATVRDDAPEDAALMRRIAHGDHAAFRALLDRHARYLYGVAHALTRNSADAEDIVQETLTAALSSHFRGESSVRTWLVKILVNRAGMLRRGQSRAFSPPVLGREFAEERPEAGPAKQAPSDARMDLATMLAALSAEHREIIVLRELEHMSYEQIAAALHLPRGTVESRLHRAREELRKRFAGYF